MKITKRQLRRIIREAVWPSYAQKGSSEYSDVIIMSPNGDSLLVNGTETYVEDVPQELSIASGFPMDDTDSDNLISALDMGVDVVGGIPHFERTMVDGSESIKILCELAEKRGLLVDLHCDETDDPMSRHVETLANETTRLGKNFIFKVIEL